MSKFKRLNIFSLLIAGFVLAFFVNANAAPAKTQTTDYCQGLFFNGIITTGASSSNLIVTGGTVYYAPNIEGYTDGFAVQYNGIYDTAYVQSNSTCLNNQFTMVLKGAKTTITLTGNDIQYRQLHYVASPVQATVVVNGVSQVIPNMFLYTEG